MRSISRIRLPRLRGGYAGPFVSALGAKSGPPGPVVISGTPAGAVMGASYVFNPGVAGGSGVKTYALTGTLPAGLSFSTSTGAITGTPTATGTFTGLSITVTDTSGSASLSGFSIAVAAGPPTLAALTVSAGSATVGTAYTGTISGRTAGSTLTASASDGTILTVNSAAGTVAGTFTVSGSPTITVTEALAGATGSPKSTEVQITVAAVVPPPAANVSSLATLLALGAI